MEIVAVLVAMVAAIFAGWAWWDAHLARLASERSASAAEQSAAAAQESLGLQKQEAAAAAEERGEAKRADIVALSWESSNREVLRGLVIQNVGRGVSKSIRALVHHGGSSFAAKSRPSLMPNEKVGLLRDDTLSPPTVEEIATVPEYRQGMVTVRITWLNEDDTVGDSGWKHARSH